MICIKIKSNVLKMRVDKYLDEEYEKPMGKAKESIFGANLYSHIVSLPQANYYHIPTKNTGAEELTNEDLPDGVEIVDKPPAPERRIKQKMAQDIGLKERQDVSGEIDKSKIKPNSFFE
jgi:hypothetical protein